MKFPFFIAIIFSAATRIFAQEPADALRYSWLTQNGTARNQAIGGAGASLGGEFTTMFINPAGLAFYKTNEFVFTPSFNMQKNKSVYNGTSDEASKNRFNVGSTGLLFSVPVYNSKSIRSYSIAFGINRVADFSNNIYYKGLNNKSSYSQKYIEELKKDNVTDPNVAASNYPFGTSLAFNTFLIDTVQDSDGNFSDYKTLSPFATGVNQESSIHTSGGITDLSLAGALNLNEKIYVGASIAVPILNYKRDSYFKESDATSNATNNFNYFEVNETLDTKGYGVNGKLGVIFKPVEYVRLGLAFQTPTYYELTDKYTTEVSTDLEGYGGTGIKTQGSGLFTNDQPAQIKYALSTPWKLTASASYVFREVEDVRKQRAFITADVEYINYKAASFSAIDETNVDDKNYYKQLSDVIDQEYKGAFNFRLGGELKFNTIMFRLGGAYYGNPYKNETASQVKLAGGVGYRDRGIFIDLTYVYGINKDVNYPYRLQNRENYYAALIKNNAGNIMATVGFKL